MGANRETDIDMKIAQQYFIKEIFLIVVSLMERPSSLHEV